MFPAVNGQYKDSISRTLRFQIYLFVLLLIVYLLVLLLFAKENKTCLDGLSELRGDFVDGLVLGFRHRESDIFVIVVVDF